MTDMGYRMIMPEKSKGRRSNTISVIRVGVAFNRTMQQTMGIRGDSRIGVFVSEDGFLSFLVLASDDRKGFQLKRNGKSATLHLYSMMLASHCEPGRYSIERRDGGFFVSDCRWKEEAR